jgi:hypothetical protein
MYKDKRLHSEHVFYVTKMHQGACVQGYRRTELRSITTLSGSREWQTSIDGYRDATLEVGDIKH